MMDRAIIAYCLGGLLLAGELSLAGGCAGRGKKAEAPTAPVATQAPQTSTPATPANPSPESVAAARAGDLTRMMGELQTLGALDPRALDQLLKDLQQTDPALWPQVMQVFRASMAYRQRALARQTAATGADAKTAPERADPTSLVAGSPGADVPPAAGGGRQPAPLDGTLPVAAQTAAATAASAATAAAGGPAPPLHGPAPNEPAARAAPAATAAAGGNPAGGNPADGTAVRQVSYEEPLAGDSQQLLAKTIHALEGSKVADDNPSAQAARQVYLRMLYLAAGRRDDAVRPIAGLPPNEQEFWAEQLFGMSTYLDADRSPDAKRRAAEARVHLTAATGHLGESGELLVRNMAFCTEVHSFGVFTPFSSAQFKPGQQVILYAEVENFKSESTTKGFHTALHSSYQIFDQQGRRVMQHDLGTTEEHCRNARRDYFIRYFLSIPARIYDGPYTLHLTIEDTLGRKIGQSTIDFSAKEK